MGAESPKKGEIDIYDYLELRCWKSNIKWGGNRREKERVQKGTAKIKSHLMGHIET